MSSSVAPTKGERTRAMIRDVALRSFRERGYDATTIRRIAQQAGVSVGTTNYHFASKEELVQELYFEVETAHRDAAQEALTSVEDLVDRLAVAYTTGLDQLTPYHRFAPEFLSAAVSPRSPLNPLSVESGPARELVLGVFRDAVAAARRSVPAEFEADLPNVLVLGHLLLALFWVYDTSPGQRRTRELLDRGLKLFKLGIPLMKVPVLRRPLKELLSLVSEVVA